jgi:hypothetical protein
VKHLKRILVPLLIFLLVLTLLPAIALAAYFPLKLDDALIADEHTKFVTLFEQDVQSKMITATVQLQNNGPEELTINGIGIEITFNEKAAPYIIGSKTLFSGNDLTGSDSLEFSKYCKPLLVAENFTAIGDTFMQRGSNGGMLSVKLATNLEPIKIPALQTINIIEFYFMPVNGIDLLDMDMFSYRYMFDTVNRYATWFGYGHCYVQATGANLALALYTVSPNSFKLHVQLPPPNVSANDTTREVTGYNPATMEWSDDIDGVYSNTVPTIGNVARTIFVRSKGSDNYIGNDQLYGDYKMGLTSEAVKVVFGDADDPGPQWEITDKKDAYGVKIPSNAHSYNAGAGVVFYWDLKQKDEGILVIPPEYFTSNKA